MISDHQAHQPIPANMSVARLAIAMALAVNAVPAAQAAPSARMFSSPDYLGQPVAFCLEGRRSCGKPAAIVWCQRNGYETALSYARRSPAAGTELRFADTGNICTSGKCISFSQIRCMRHTQ